MNDDEPDLHVQLYRSFWQQTQTFKIKFCSVGFPSVKWKQFPALVFCWSLVLLATAWTFLHRMVDVNRTALRHGQTKIVIKPQIFSLLFIFFQSFPHPWASDLCLNNKKCTAHVHRLKLRIKKIGENTVFLQAMVKKKKRFHVSF